MNLGVCSMHQEWLYLKHYCQMEVIKCLSIGVLANSKEPSLHAVVVLPLVITLCQISALIPSFKFNSNFCMPDLGAWGEIFSPCTDTQPFIMSPLHLSHSHTFADVELFICHPRSVV